MKDRIDGLIRVKASDLLPNPKNWRTHPAAQRAALTAVLDEIGYVDAIKVVKTRKGLMIVDGHLRQDVSGDDEVPVMVLNISAGEADKMLATFDPLAAMARADDDKLRALLGSLGSDDDLVQFVAKRNGLYDFAHSEPNVAQYEQRYSVVVECDDEAQQRTIYERLNEEGLKCRLLML